jgi:hypothetical protein
MLGAWATRWRELAGLLVGGQQALRERAALGQGAQLGPAPRVAVVGREGRRALEVLQRLGQLGPQAGRARVLGGDQREVAVDAAAEVQRLAQVVAGVARRLVHVARDGRDRRDLEGRQVGDRAALADRPRGERGEAGEVADHGVAPTLLARLLLDLGAEDVRGVLFKIVALEDEAVAWIDLPELAAAGAPEEHVHDIVRTRKQVLARGALAREAKRDLEVVTQQHPLAQLSVGRAGQKAGWDHEHAEAARDQQIEAAAHEVGVGRPLLVVRVLVLPGILAATAVRRVGDDVTEGALIARGVLAHPPLERHREQLDVGAHRREHLGADLGELDRGPAGLLVARVGDEAARRAIRADQAADADAGLQSSHDAVVAGEIGEQRTHQIGDLLGDRGRREKLVGQREVVGDQARRELVHHRLDRQAAPAAVAEHRAALLGGHVLRAPRGDDAHRLEVPARAAGLRHRFGRQRLVAPRLAALEESADDGLERRPHADDEGVEVGERDARRDRGAPERQELLKSLGGGGHGWCSCSMAFISSSAQRGQPMPCAPRCSSAVPQVSHGSPTFDPSASGRAPTAIVGSRGLSSAMSRTASASCAPSLCGCRASRTSRSSCRKNRSVSGSVRVMGVAVRDGLREPVEHAPSEGAQLLLLAQEVGERSLLGRGGGGLAGELPLSAHGAAQVAAEPVGAARAGAVARGELGGELPGARARRLPRGLRRQGRAFARRPVGEARDELQDLGEHEGALAIEGDAPGRRERALAQVEQHDPVVRGEVREAQDRGDALVVAPAHPLGRGVLGGVEGDGGALHHARRDGAEGLADDQALEQGLRLVVVRVRVGAARARAAAGAGAAPARGLRGRGPHGAARPLRPLATDRVGALGTGEFL